MAKISNKKHYKSKLLKKKNIIKKTKKRRINYRKKKKIRGGATNNNQQVKNDEQLRNNIRQIYTEQNNLNLSNNQPTKKKGLISEMLSGFFPLNLISRYSDVEESQKKIQEQDLQNETKLKEEINSKMEESERNTQEAANEINSTIDRITSKNESQGFFSTLGGRVGDMYRTGFKKIRKLTIGGDKVEEPKTEKEKLQFKLKRQCDSEFISNLEPLLDTCSKEEVINVYNEITKKLKTKKNFFIPKLKRDIEELKFLDYEKPQEIKFETNISDMELEPDSKDKIQKLQSNIREELKTVEEKKLKLKKKLKN